jgi:UDP-galactopyranose mutase
LPVERITPKPYYYIHYAGDEPYTRIIEYKLLTGYKAPDTLIIVETPSFNNKLYPYPIKSEIAKAGKYLNALPSDVYSLGRLGRYHYDNMDVIVKDCMQLIKIL